MQTPHPYLKIELRAGANKPFVQGYPGLPEPVPGRDTRQRCTATGTVELRTTKPLKAEWLQISLFKTETLPIELGGTVFRENVHGAITLWSAPAGAGYGLLESKDVPFSLDIPPHLPSSVDVAQGNVRARGHLPGITYTLEVTLMERSKKKGLLRKEVQPLSTFVQPFEVLSHNLHPSWPSHTIPRTLRFTTPALDMSVTLLNSALSPGTTLSLPIELYLPSSTAPPVTVQVIQLTLVETTTFRSGAGAVVRTRPMDIAQSRLEAGQGETLTPGPAGGRSWRLMLGLPGSRYTGEGNLGCSATGKHIEVAFALRVEVLGVVHGRLRHGAAQQEVIAKAVVENVLVDWMQTGREADTVREIGYVPALCQRPTPVPALSPDPSFNSSPSPSVDMSPYGRGPAFVPPIASSPSITPLRQTQPSPPAAQAPRLTRPSSSSASVEQSYRPTSAPRASLVGRPLTYLPQEQDEFFGSSISPSPPASSAHSDLGNGQPSSRAPGYAEQGNARLPSAKEEKAQAFESAQQAAARVQDGLPPDAPSGGSQQTSRNPSIARAPQLPGSSPTSLPQPQWESAAAEKKRLFEQLQHKAAGEGLGHNTSSASSAGSSSAHALASSVSQPATAGSSSTAAPAPRWETAAEEKARLFREAQGRVAKVQGADLAQPTIDLSLDDAQSSASPPPLPPAGGSSSSQGRRESAAGEKAKLFNEAQARSSPRLEQSSSPTSSPPRPTPSAAASSSSAARRSYVVASPPSFETAEQEKARLRRQYEQAQAAVSLRQNLPHRVVSSPSVAGPASSSTAPLTIHPKAPTPPLAQATFPSANEEKARMRFLDAVAARDQAAAGPSSEASGSVAETASVTSSAPGQQDEPVPYDALFGGPQHAASNGGSARDRALTEKEQQKLYYDAQEAVARSAMGFGNGGSSSQATSTPLPTVVPTPNTARPRQARHDGESPGAPGRALDDDDDDDDGRTTPTSTRPSVVSSSSSVPYLRDPAVALGKQRAPRPPSAQSAPSFASPSHPPSGKPAPALATPPPPPPAERPPDDYTMRYLYTPAFAGPQQQQQQQQRPPHLPFYPPPPPQQQPLMAPFFPTGAAPPFHPGLMPAWGSYSVPTAPYAPQLAAAPASPPLAGRQLPYAVAGQAGRDGAAWRRESSLPLPLPLPLPPS